MLFEESISFHITTTHRVYNGDEVNATMAQGFQIPPVPEFQPDAELGASLASKWRTWLADFEMFLTASGITNATRKRALLLYLAGSRVREIFQHLQDVGNADDYDTAKTKLTTHFEPQKNRRYEVYRFRETKQEQGETLDQYHTRLRALSTACEFQDLEFEIEQQIVVGGISSRIRRRALRDPTYDLKQMLLDGRREEMSSFQTREIESNENTAAVVHPFKSVNKEGKKCYTCGGDYPHKGECPAKGKQCGSCGKQGHFAVVCKSKGDKIDRRNKGGRSHRKHKPRIRPLKHTEYSSSSEDEYMYAISSACPRTPQVWITVAGHKFKALVDSGATINVIDADTFANLKNVKLLRTSTKAYPYQSKIPVEFLGKFESIIETKKKCTVGTVYVVKGKDSGCLLSLQTAQELGLIKLQLNAVQSQNLQDDSLAKILQQYSSVFQGLGKLKNHQVKLNIDSSVPPVAQPQRRIPFHIRKKVKVAIKELESQGIIEKVPDSQPTPWVSAIVAVPKKDGSVRICVDMRAANTAIKRVRHLIPTVADISLELNGARFFSKLDLSQAYHQLELHPDSRFITTFSTHLGLYRYTRLNFGTNASAELFQHTLQQHLQGMAGVRNIADDILVFGSTRQEHDQALENCLKRLKEKGLTLNKSKCSFLNTELEFFGQIFSEQGTRPDPRRTQDVIDAAIPQNVSELRSFLGMVTFSSKYIANFATIATPLRELTKTGVTFTWEQKHQTAFDKLKAAITKPPVMAYFDAKKDTVLTVDASPVGLSGILSQRSACDAEGKVVAYASRALSDVERRYSQTEKEALSIVWAIEHFHLYLYGHSFTLETDHKPLEMIYGRANSKPCARIERWVLRLQPYNFQVKYKPGPTNQADFLSRHPSMSNTGKQSKIADEYVHFIVQNAVPKSMTLSEIREETDKDRVLKALRAAIRLNRWDADTVKPFRPVKDELSIDSSNIILRGARIVIPESLHKKAVDLAHVSHQGLEKTKALLREKIWFPGIDVLVKETITKCVPCQAVGRSSPPEPLHMTEMPSAPWQKINIDFLGPLPSGELLLVVIDRYSRYPEVEIVRSTKSSVVIPKLDKIFAVHGIPFELTSDNGPPFNGDEFSRYLKLLGVKFTRSTPKWPQGNAEVERFMQPLAKALTTAVVEGKKWQQELCRFLLQYRTTPHSTTKVPPSELLFNRTVRGALPTLKPRTIVNRHKEAKDNEQKRCIYNKTYADLHRNAKESSIKVGDTVLVQQEKKQKLMPKFNTTPYKVIARKGTTVVAENKERHRITRNVSHFKQIPDVNEMDYSSEEERNNEPEPACEYRRSNRTRRAPVRYGHGLSY